MLPRRRGEFLIGKITRDRGDDTYDILYDVIYDDGEPETRVAKRLIRKRDNLKQAWTGEDPREWEGVTVADGRVTALSLWSLAALPDAIDELKALTMFSLRGCSSIAALPDAICELGALTKLDLNGCSSLAALPAAIGELKALRELDLSGCTSLENLPEGIVEREGLNVALPFHLTIPASLREDFAVLRKLRDESECEDSERLREGSKVEVNYRGCPFRVRYSPFLSRVPRRRPRSECSHAGAARSIPERLRGTEATIRTTSTMMTESGRRASRSA